LTINYTDVQGVIHVASDVSFTPDPNIVVPIAVNLATAALKAAAAAHSSSVQRFILTSSAAAASAYAPNIPRTVTSSSWSTSYMAEAKKPGPYGPERGLSSYGASKALAEKAIWEWVAGNKGKSPLVVNTVLPDFNLGLPISPENQGWPSTAGMAVALFNGDVKNGRLTPPQHFVAVQDTALLHVAALLHPNVRNQRIFGLAEPKNANDILRILKELYPQRSFAEEDPDEGQDLVKVVEKDRAEELLVWIAGKKWTSLRDSVKEVGDYLIAHEKSS
jgi:nucleoside-diphosphate-sugar epimerase